MNKRLGFLIASAFVLISSVSLVWNNTVITKQHSTQPNTSQHTSSGLSLPVNQSQILKDWAKRQESFTNTEALRKAFPHTVKIPTTSSVFTQVYLTRGDSPENTEIHMFDANGATGIQLHIYQFDGKPKFQEWVNQEIKEKEEGIYKADKLPTIINFNGSDALAIEPGYNLVFNEKQPRPGVLSWWDNGIIYELYGTFGESGTSVDQLIQIANSFQ